MTTLISAAEGESKVSSSSVPLPPLTPARNNKSPSLGCSSLRLRLRLRLRLTGKVQERLEVRVEMQGGVALEQEEHTHHYSSIREIEVSSIISEFYCPQKKP